MTKNDAVTAADAPIYTLANSISEGIENLHRQSKTEEGKTARIAMMAIANFLDERGLIDHLSALSDKFYEDTGRQKPYVKNKPTLIHYQ